MTHTPEKVRREGSRQLAVFGIFATLALACANPGPPPGARQRLEPPQVIGITPDTSATKVRNREVVIEFDAVINERPAAPNASELRDLVIVSPRHGDVNVNWRRNNLTIRPKQGWQPNTTYTVTVLPGIADLQGNVRKEPLSLVFSTGDSITSGMISGTVFDWVDGKPAIGAIVEAVPRPDSSFIYTTQSDSAGNFRIRVPGHAAYTVRTSINTTRDRVFDERMSYDTTQLSIRDSADIELLAYTRDTAGPQLGVVRTDDSITLRAMFTGVLNPMRTLELSQFTLMSKDSTPVEIVSVTPATLVNATQDDATDSVADTVGRDTLNRPEATGDTLPTIRKPSKPLLYREVVIVVRTPLHPKTDYILRATNIVSPDGVATASTDRAFTTPAAPEKPKDAQDTSAAKNSQ